MAERELVWLLDHLAACDPDDPSIGLGVGSILRHFRLVEVEESRERMEQRGMAGGMHDGDLYGVGRVLLRRLGARRSR